MTEVNDLSALALENATHYVDGGIVAIKKAGRRDDTDFILKLITHAYNRLTKIL
jgi:hypothetical protein